MVRLKAQRQQWLDFVLTMTEKEIRVRYKNAFFGFLWIFLNPLLQMAVIGLVFQFFVPVKVDNYFLFLFTGLLPWNFFSYTVLKNTPMVINERELIRKAKFPRESIVLSVVLSNLFHFLIALGILMVLLAGDKLLFEQYGLSQLLFYILRMLWVVPLVLLLTLFTSGLSLLLATLNVWYRDVNFFIQAVMPLWFYATPVIYTLKLLPPYLHILFYLNPLTSLIELFHLSLLNIPVTNTAHLTIGFFVGAIITVVGWCLFKKHSKTFDDWI